ncbi:MAG TPA: hypothetical protein VHB25_07690 [Gemmatimonadaceae bacterium]|nr:hypothetical protein [Gemmatimonadaceae bacterium]
MLLVVEKLSEMRFLDGIARHHRRQDRDALQHDICQGGRSVGDLNDRRLWSEADRAY